ncbi:glycosyltransferase [Acidobacteria bacterium AB60]|nr:glycosyltransferase [Acidobacteria bacterium AB60]
MKIVFYGLTITSSWGNGHATTYRSLLKALAARGHQLLFVEKDVEWYRNNRDLPQPEFCAVSLYDDWRESARSLLSISRGADAIVIGSYFPDAIPLTTALVDNGFDPILYYDIDTPITFTQLCSAGRTDYLDAALIPFYSAYLSFTGGPILREIETRFGSPRALPFYCSVDADVYRPFPPRAAFQCDLSYLGTYAPDRQAKLEGFLNDTARTLPEAHFIVAGPQYPDTLQWPTNVQRIIHLSPQEHPQFYSSSRFTLNLTRSDMVKAGYSPSVRLFEASACGAAIVSDAWPGLEDFLAPGQEVLLPADAYDVAQILTAMPEQERARYGRQARERILAHHTSAHRALQFEQIVATCLSAKPHETASSSSRD